MRATRSWVLLVVCVSLAAAVVRAAAPPVSAESVLVPVDADGVQRLEMVLDSYSYSPQHISVQAGRPVELLLTSVTFLTPHNFVLKDEAAGLSIDVDVGAGKTHPVRFTPTQKGVFTFYCDKKLLFFASHREKGMEGTMEVR